MFREARNKIIISLHLSGSCFVPASLLAVSENVMLHFKGIQLLGPWKSFDLFRRMILLCTYSLLTGRTPVQTNFENLKDLTTRKLQ